MTVLLWIAGGLIVWAGVASLFVLFLRACRIAGRDLEDDMEAFERDLYTQ